MFENIDIKNRVPTSFSDLSPPAVTQLRQHRDLSIGQRANVMTDQYMLMSIEHAVKVLKLQIAGDNIEI
jgi:hypothetical protein